jgi:hypothetical protein
MNAVTELADRLIQTSVSQYEAEGEIRPKVVIEAPHFSLLLWPSAAECDDVPEWAARVIAVLGAIGGVETAALVTEAWFTRAPAVPDPQLERGELGRRAQTGDASVGTTLVVAATDGASIETRIRMVDGRADDGTITWGRADGNITGRVPGLVAESFVYAQRVTPSEGKASMSFSDVAAYADALSRMAPMLDADCAVLAH